MSQGSSALQIVPALQPRVAKLYNYVRGKTWLALPFAGSKMTELLGRDPTSDNCRSCYVLLQVAILRALHADVFTDEEKEKFKDPEYYRKFRHALEDELNVWWLDDDSQNITNLSTVRSSRHVERYSHAEGRQRSFKG